MRKLHSVIADHRLSWVCDRGVNGNLKRITAHRVALEDEMDLHLTKLTGSLDIAWLQAFVVLERCRTQSGAARFLHVKQSTVSRYITNLEAWLGRPLIERYDPLQLTLFGGGFLTTADHVIEVLNSKRRFNPTPEALTRNVSTLNDYKELNSSS